MEPGPACAAAGTQRVATMQAMAKRVTSRRFISRRSAGAGWPGFEPGISGDAGEEFDLAGDLDFEGEGRFGPIERLEREIQRRLDRKSLRKSPVTLFELIIELKNLEKEERRRRRLPPLEDSLIEADDVVGIAHEEGYQDSSRQVIEECLANADPDTEITLTELCRDLGWELPDVYIPLLFLALDGRCSIRQEEFFGDVFVQVVKVDGA